MASLSGCFLIGGSGERWPIIAYFLIIGSDAPAALSIDAIVSPALALPCMFSVLSAPFVPLRPFLPRSLRPEASGPAVVDVATYPNPKLFHAWDHSHLALKPAREKLTNTNTRKVLEKMAAEVGRDFGCPRTQANWILLRNHADEVEGRNYQELWPQCLRT